MSSVRVAVVALKALLSRLLRRQGHALRPEGISLGRAEEVPHIPRALPHAEAVQSAEPSKWRARSAHPLAGGAGLDPSVDVGIGGGTGSR
eukprot:9504522-Alexandrium_andersonii.AAC.1